MTNNKNRPNWPFLAEKNSSKGATSAFELNQSLSVALDDDSLRNELIDMFSQRVKSRVQAFPSAFHPDDEYRSRAYSHLPPAGHRNNTWLVAGYKETVEVLTKPEVFSNVPYAELGDRSFLLAIDPYHTTDQTNKDESARAEGTYLRQFNYLNQLSQSPCDQQLSKLANEAVRHAVIAGLTRDRFDLAAFAEQAPWCTRYWVSI